MANLEANSSSCSPISTPLMEEKASMSKTSLAYTARGYRSKENKSKYQTVEEFQKKQNIGSMYVTLITDINIVRFVVLSGRG